MKDISSKIHAIIAMAISLVSFGFMIASLVAMINYVPQAEEGFGVSPSFAFWLYGILIAMFSLIFYLVDAVLSIIKVFKRIDPVFNGILALLLIGAVPMVIFVGGGLGINVYIWNAYYLGIFVLEIISIVKLMASINTERRCNNAKA